ncbi:hypothetical protein [Bosea sp. (in: a-proteobacteria)]|jgi:hypothetical protein|uniref:hypothetical protein n=1 Tax=Bosea sp. (in: a-proteobacteria) TaxID=1871050 RepID=UPI00356567BA
MTKLPERAQFAACQCGSASIVIPAEIVDDAPVSCGCGRVIGSWLGYKSFVSRSITLEAHGFPNTPLICVDPIMPQSFEVFPADP